MKLRPYQQQAIDGILRELETNDSTLVVLPTGTGKTVVFAHAIEHFTRMSGRAMVIAHRIELIDQAARTIERVCGCKPDIEMADRWADNTMYQRAKVVVSSVQTQTASRGGRMSRFDPKHFQVLVIDEAHHATADSYRKVIDHYTKDGCKVIGVTATPDRTDEEALGQVFQSVAYNYEIVQAISDGWLVPIHQDYVEVSGLDFSKARTTAGDLNGADLAAIMEQEEMLHKIAHPTIELARGRKTLVFAASVMHAELLSAIFNRHRTGSAEWVSGETPSEVRKDIFARYKNDDFQFLVNVGVATEGFDEPGIEVVAMGRPTKSRSLYAQMAGRGTRPLPGLVDGLDTAQARVGAIAGSQKPHLSIIDFVGNSGRHKLVSVADILGSDYDESTVERAKQNMMGGADSDPSEALAAAEKELIDEAIAEESRARDAQEERDAAWEEVKNRQSSIIGDLELERRRNVVAFSTYVKDKVDPFGLYDIRAVRERGWDKIRPVTEKQRAILDKRGIDYSKLNGTQVKKLLDGIFKRIKAGLATDKQIGLLKKHGYDAKQWSMKAASQKIDAIAKNGWRRPD